TALFLPSGALTGQAQWFLPDTPLTWNDVRALNERGLIAYSRDVLLDPPKAQPGDPWRGMDGYVAWQGLAMTLVVAALFAAYVVIMLAGAAFSIAARRQQRSLAVAASVGATGADLRRTIVLQGAVLGFAGGIVG